MIFYIQLAPDKRTAMDMSHVWKLELDDSTVNILPKHGFITTLTFSSKATAESVYQQLLDCLIESAQQAAA